MIVAQYKSSTYSESSAYACGEEVSVNAVRDDNSLERSIGHQAMLLHTAQTPNERRAAWNELTRLHAMRSPQRIAEMEEATALRVR